MPATDAWSGSRSLVVPPVGRPGLKRYVAAHLAGAFNIFSRRPASPTSDNKVIEEIRERTLMAKLNINGTIRDVEVEPDTPLLWVIREQVGLTGTKYGCGVAPCGACSVQINGNGMRSCSFPVGSVSVSDRIITIEGLSSDRSHPVQKA